MTQAAMTQTRTAMTQTSTAIALSAMTHEQVARVDLTAEPSQPAPGSHNAELYLELDFQPIPADTRGHLDTFMKARAWHDKTRRWYSMMLPSCNNWTLCRFRAHAHTSCKCQFAACNLQTTGERERPQ
jgi:hypothetical protein